MLSEAFYWLCNISIIGSITGILVLILRRIKLLPRFGVYFLWLIVLIKFWVPFGIANQYSLMNFISRFGTKTIVLYNRSPLTMDDFNLRITATNSLQAARSYHPLVYKTNVLKDIFQYASVVWIIVSIAALLTVCLLYYFTKSELKNVELIRDNIYQSDQIGAPAVYGIIHPRIIIPSSVAKGNIDYIILHEQVHIKRRDNLLRVVAVLTACVHWFNPLAWIFLKYFLIDMELACDAKVVKQLDQSSSKEYALAVLNASAGRAFFVSAFGGAKTKVRVEHILSYKKLAFLSLLVIIIMVGVIAITMLTNAVG